MGNLKNKKQINLPWINIRRNNSHSKRMQWQQRNLRNPI